MKKNQLKMKLNENDGVNCKVAKKSLKPLQTCRPNK